MDCADNEFVALTVYYWKWTIFESQTRQSWDFVTEFYALIWVMKFCVFYH